MIPGDFDWARVYAVWIAAVVAAEKASIRENYQFHIIETADHPLDNPKSRAISSDIM